MTSRSGIHLAISLLLTFASAPAVGQADQTAFEAQESALDELESIAAQRQLSVSGSRYAHISGGPATLAEVLRDPDNLELNYRYAQTLIADRNFRSASAALERILLVDDKQHAIRLLYARVLFELDSRIESAAQLELVDVTKLPANLQNSAQRLADRLAGRERATTFWADVGGGLRYQSNANFAPDDERIDAVVATPFGPFAVTVPTDDAEDDLSYLANLSGGFEHSLRTHGDHTVFGAASMQWNEQVEVDSTDYSSYAGNLGFKWGGARLDAIAQVLGGHFRLDDDAFLDFYGVDLKLVTGLTGNLRGMLRHRSTYQDYDDAPNDTAERTGMLYELEIGARYRLTSRQRVDASIEFQRKSARRDWREFDAWIWQVSHLWLPGRSVYVRNRFAVGNEHYDAANPRVSSTIREDANYLYQFSISSELAGIFGHRTLPGWLSDMRVTGAASYRRTDSNVRNFEYDNVSGELLFNKRFDF